MARHMSWVVFQDIGDACHPEPQEHLDMKEDGYDKVFFLGALSGFRYDDRPSGLTGSCC